MSGYREPNLLAVVFRTWWLATNADGRLELFVTTNDGINEDDNEVWHVWQLHLTMAGQAGNRWDFRAVASLST